MVSLGDFEERLILNFGLGYSYVSGFVDWTTECSVMCSIHGTFNEKPKSLIRGTSVCKMCRKHTQTHTSVFNRSVLVYGVGTNDLNSNLFDDFSRYKKIQNTWISMLRRCYSKDEGLKSYCDSYASYEWLSCAKFFEDIRGVINYEMLFNGWHLDKDVLSEGVGKYSKNTCCIIPQEINNLLIKSSRKNSTLPTGVYKRKNRDIYVSSLSIEGNPVYLGSFKDPTDAFNAYKKAKETYIKQVANKWKGKIDNRVYEALMNYQVKITD